MYRICIVALSLLSLAAASSAPKVATRMRHVVFHLDGGVELRVDDLVGHLVSRTSGPPLFDDVNSYIVDMRYGRVSLTPQSLTNLMNNHVFASDKAPLKDIQIGVEGDQLTQKGTLKKGIGIPFSMRATIAATPDGRIRLHPTSMKAAGFVSKRVLDFFGLELENIVKMKNVTGVAVDGDDLLLDPAHLLPPPQIRGRLTRAAVENGVIMQQFGTSPRGAIAPNDRRFANYMYYRGGRLRFGKLTMTDTDLLLVDADQKDQFDFSPKNYTDQLVAGYSKNTRARGLIVYMPDLADLRQRSTRQTRGPAPASETQTAAKREP